jgi:hypothetical protein
LNDEEQAKAFFFDVSRVDNNRKQQSTAKSQATGWAQLKEGR